MTKINYHNASFLISAAKLNQLPPDKGAEIAFIGRSNAGKSSALNVITGIRGLARVSKTPGRTQLINLFSINDNLRFVDLPGYGYAKVPFAVKEQWQKTVNEYLEKRQCLRGLVLVMDIRHPLKELDQQLLNWATICNLPVHILLTKVDKLKNAAAMAVLTQVQQAVSHYDNVTIQTFSSQTNAGLENVLLQLNTWFNRE